MNVHMNRSIIMNGTALLVAGLTLTACATTKTANPQASPSSNQLTNAIVATASRGTANLTVEIIGEIEELTGTGFASLTSGTGQVTWTNLATETEITELYTKDGLYSLIDGSWFLAPAGTFTPTSGAISPLSGLSELTANPENPLSGQLPLTIESGLNFSEEELLSIPTECPDTIAVEITLTESGLINEIAKEFNCPGYQRVSLVRLSDFGTSLNLVEPVDPIEVPGNQ